MVEISIKIIETADATHDLLCDIRKLAIRAERWPDLKDTAKALAVITDSLEAALDEMEYERRDYLHNDGESDPTIA